VQSSTLYSCRFSFPLQLLQQVPPDMVYSLESHVLLTSLRLLSPTRRSIQILAGSGGTAVSPRLEGLVRLTLTPAAGSVISDLMSFSGPDYDGMSLTSSILL